VNVLKLRLLYILFLCMFNPSSVEAVKSSTCIIKVPAIYSLIQSNKRRPNHLDGISTSQYIPSAANTVTSKETMKATPLAFE
jgi:hypothetical protein